MYLMTTETRTETRTVSVVPTVSVANGEVLLIAAACDADASHKAVTAMTAAEAAEVGRQLMRAARGLDPAVAADDEAARLRAALNRYSMDAGTADHCRGQARAATAALGLPAGCAPADITAAVAALKGTPTGSPTADRSRRSQAENCRDADAVLAAAGITARHLSGPHGHVEDKTLLAVMESAYRRGYQQGAEAGAAAAAGYSLSVLNKFLAAVANWRHRLCPATQREEFVHPPPVTLFG